MLLKEEGKLGSIIENMREMLHGYSEATKVQVSFQLQGDPVVIPLSLQPTLLRVMQESLTNAKRHGKANLEVSLTCSTKQVKLCISDNGMGVNEVSPGFGLLNMRERVEEHGGTIQFESEIEKAFGYRLNFHFRRKRG